MDIEDIREYCLSRKGAEEGFPFGEGVLVFKVMGKIFALLSLEPPFSINLKCNPDRAIELREQYESVVPGYHMNKVHWNTVYLEGDVPSREIKEMVDHSYELIVQSLKKADREALNS